MNNSKLYNMAAKIAVDKLVPKPIHITISMQGGGGLSSIGGPVIRRFMGGNYSGEEMTEEEFAGESSSRVSRMSPGGLGGSTFDMSEWASIDDGPRADMLNPSIETLKNQGTDPGESSQNLQRRVQQNLRLEGPPPALERLPWDKWIPEEQKYWKEKYGPKFGIPQENKYPTFNVPLMKDFRSNMPVINPNLLNPNINYTMGKNLFEQLKDTQKFDNDSQIRDFIDALNKYGKRAASGGGISSLNENIVYRFNGGGFGFTEDDIEAMQDWQGYTDPSDTRTDNDTATVRPAGLRVSPLPPKSPRGPDWEPLLPPRAIPRIPQSKKFLQKHRPEGQTPIEYLPRISPLNLFKRGEKNYDDAISEEEFMRGVKHTQEHFNKPFYKDRNSSPDLNTEDSVVRKIRRGQEAYLTPKEKEVWDRMQGKVGEADSYNVPPILQNELDRILSKQKSPGAMGGIKGPIVIDELRPPAETVYPSGTFPPELADKMKQPPSKYGENIIGSGFFKDDMIKEIEKDLQNKQMILNNDVANRSKDISLRRDALQEAFDIGELTPSQIDKIQSKLFDEEDKLKKDFKTLKTMDTNLNTLIKDPDDFKMKNKAAYQEWNRINKIERLGEPGSDREKWISESTVFENTPGLYPSEMYGKKYFRPKAASGGGIASLNEKVVYRQGGGPPGTKLWNETNPDLPMAEYKVNHNGGLSLMMKGDDGRFYTRGGTDQRGLYYPEEVREQSVSDELVVDKEDKDSVDPKGAKGPKPFPTSFEIQPPTTRPLPISPVERTNVMKTIPSLGMPRKLTRRNLDSDETTRPVKRNIFNTSLPQPVGDGERIGSPYPAYDRDLATTELLAARDRGELDANWMTKDWIGTNRDYGIPMQESYGPFSPGTHDPRGIASSYIAKLQEQGTYDPQNYDRNRYNQAAEALSRDNPATTSSYTEYWNELKHGGGISSLNDSININGQPHRLVWANPQEERVLKKMGGSGKKVLGKPAYYYGSYGADPLDITEDMTAEDINIGMESGDISTFGMGETAIDQQGGPDYPTAMSLYDPEEYSKMYKGIDDVYTEADTERVAPITFAELGATRKQDAGARRRFINQHLANYPGGRRDPVTQELFEADKDYDRAIKKYGSSMLQTLRDSYAGNQDVFGAMFGHATKLVQDRLNAAINKEIELTPEAEQVDSKEYREGIVDAVLSNPATALKEFGLTDVTKSKGFIDPPKEGSWMDKAKQFLTPTIVKGLDALNQGIPALLDIWGVGKVNGEGVYIKKDGTLIPFTTETERGNIESGSLRGENIDPLAKKLKPRLVQVASAEEVVEEKPSALKRLLDARSETSSLDKLYEDMKARVNPLYNRNIFT